MNVQLKTVSREIPYLGGWEVTDDMDYSWTYISQSMNLYLLISVPGGYVWATVGPNIIRTTSNDTCFASKVDAIKWALTYNKGTVRAHESLINAVDR